jgi:cation transport regulator
MPRKSSTSSSSSTLRRKSTTRRRGKHATRGRTNSSTTRGSRTNNSTSSRRGSSSSSALSARTRKAIDTLPSHAQKIYTKAHKNALKQYESPSKRREGKHQSKEQVAHKVAWSAVKKEYKKKGDTWVSKKDY